MYFFFFFWEKTRKLELAWHENSLQLFQKYSLQWYQKFLVFVLMLFFLKSLILIGNHVLYSLFS